MRISLNSPNSFHFASQPISIRLKINGALIDTKSEETDPADFETVLRAKCPSLFTNFRPPWWLYFGHFQTIYGVLSRSEQVWYHRLHLELRDGGTIGLDFSPADMSSLPDETPIIVIQTGFSGGSYEPYIRSILAHACSPDGLGYRAVVVTYRGCAGVPLTSPQLFASGDTDDLRQALMYISHRYPRARLLGLGFSMGANKMTRYMAQEGLNSRLNSACLLCCPWNITDNCLRLQKLVFHRNLYGKGMGRNMITLLRMHYKTLVLDNNPDHPMAKAVPQVLDLPSPSIDEFDAAFTRFFAGQGPVSSFPSLEAYYTAHSSHEAVRDVQMPMLCINATDDPIVHHIPSDAKDNPGVVMVRTKRGGHLGWFVNAKDRWTTKPVLEWLKLFGEEVIERSQSRAGKTFIDKDGFLMEDGNEHLGCRLAGNGSLIDGKKLRHTSVLGSSGILMY
ncbi:Alpha/Beta hydrolase protein [Mycena floridula]|nr:Alpha/Beta hydrolase protein [Mycena floridula]